MKTMKLILLSAVLALPGCATDMTHYYQTVQAANNSAAEQAAARITALQAIGQTGGEGAKVAAAIMLGMGGGAQGGGQVQPMLPKSFADSAREWASILVPGIVQLGQSYIANKAIEHQADRSTELGVVQSNNAAAATASTNGTFGAMASAGYSAAASIAGQIKQPAPNITIGGNGVIGSGTYSAQTIGGNGATGTSGYTSNPITGSYNPIDNSQRNPVDNSQRNPIDNSNQNNPVGH